MTPTDELIAALPERIWAASRGTGFSAGADSIVDYTWGEWQSVKRPYTVEYVRADRLASLTAPVGEWETTAEDREFMRLWSINERNGEPWIRDSVAELLRDFGRALASLSAERDQNKRLVEAGRTLTGWREHDYPEHFDRWTAQYLSDRYRAALAQPEKQR